MNQTMKKKKIFYAVNLYKLQFFNKNYSHIDILDEIENDLLKNKISSLINIIGLFQIYLFIYKLKESQSFYSITKILKIFCRNAIESARLLRDSNCSTLLI